MYLLGYDIGSSSIKACLVDAHTGKRVAGAFYPKQEMSMETVCPGWAEQAPDSWWDNLKLATQEVLRTSRVQAADIKAIGISYQMHGLVVVNKNQQPLRPSIIWCDSRAVPYGEAAFNAIGQEKCLSHLLNSPGNFTAAKLAWVKENEPEIYSHIDKIMLPGDYIGMRLTGEPVITVEGLSEAVLWDFKNHCLSEDVMRFFGFDASLIPSIRPTFAEHGRVSAAAAQELGLAAGTPLTYRAGDQPNNALSLNVFNPGEIASTAGTSGVVYGVNGQVKYDPLSRINTFAHVNYTETQIRLGVLLCINGTGILNSWMKKNVLSSNCTYEDMNKLAAQTPIGAGGLSILPFGNGAERVLENKEINCSIHGLNFNVHNQQHLFRAAQEGIVYSFQYGMEVMANMGMDIHVVRAGNANMFLSPLFREALGNTANATIELYDTDGAVGAAKGAGLGAGIYHTPEEAFASLEKLAVIEPEVQKVTEYQAAYHRWKKLLENNNR